MCLIKRLTWTTGLHLTFPLFLLVEKKEEKSVLWSIQVADPQEAKKCELTVSSHETTSDFVSLR